MGSNKIGTLSILMSLTLPISTSFAQNETSIDVETLKKDKAVKEEIVKKKKYSDDVEKIEVTGSHIKRIDIEGPSPVQVLDREDLDRSGYNSVGDVLRDITASSFGGPRESSGSALAGVASVSLRGLGSNRTLVLLNGKRLPTDAIGGSVDLNLIPMAAVERIEILKDGASAIYGSDALGGVVNMITRKDFDGNQINMSGSATQQGGGGNYSVSLTNGFNTGKVNMVNVIQTRRNDEVYARDRDWSNDGVSPTGSPGSSRIVNADGSSEPWRPDPNCPADKIIDLGAAGQRCSFNYSEFSTSQPQIEQQALMSETNVQLNDATKMKLRVTGSQKKTFWQYAPSPGGFAAGEASAAASGNPDYDSGDTIVYAYRLTELGNRQSEITTNSFNVTTGLSREVGETWEVEVDTSINRVFREDLGVEGYALEDKVREAIANNEFNPLGDPGERGDITSAKYEPFQKNMSELLATEVKASGEVAELGNGLPVVAAIGYSNTAQGYTDNFDDESLNQNVIGSSGSAGGGTRYTNSAFTELSIPLTESLEMQMAARYDDYSDFGSTANPKMAFLYRPNNQWLLRASAGTGFKAPDMVDLYASEGFGWPTMIDTSQCNAQKAAGGPTPACLPAQYLAQFGGNEDLEEEKSETYNMGAVYQPTKDTNLGVDLWYTKLSNSVGVDYQAIMDAEAAGIDVASKGVTIQRNATTQEIEQITAPNQNLAARELYGIDASIGQKFYTGAGRFRVNIEHSHLFFYKYEGFEGVGFKNILGERATPPWRNNVTLAYAPTENQEGSIVAKTIAAHDKEIPEYGELQQYTEYDFQYNYSTSKYGTFGGGVKNLFKTTPPLDDSNINNQLVRTLYSDLGQTAYLSYSKAF